MAGVPGPALPPPPPAPPQQQYCLRWNNHQNNLLSVFEDLLNHEAFVDVTIACDGLNLKAHKMVLSACSPYFQSMFYNTPDKHPIVFLKDVRYDEMKALLEFMYRGEVSVDQEHLGSLLKVAEGLRIKGLAEVNETHANLAAAAAAASQIPPPSRGGMETVTSQHRHLPPLSLPLPPAHINGGFSVVSSSMSAGLHPVGGGLLATGGATIAAASSGDPQRASTTITQHQMSLTSTSSSTHDQHAPQPLKRVIQSDCSSSSPGNTASGAGILGPKRKRGRPRRLSGTESIPMMTTSGNEDANGLVKTERCESPMMETSSPVVGAPLTAASATTPPAGNMPVNSSPNPRLPPALESQADDIISETEQSPVKSLKEGNRASSLSPGESKVVDFPSEAESNDGQPPGLLNTSSSQLSPPPPPTPPASVGSDLTPGRSSLIVGDPSGSSSPPPSSGAGMLMSPPGNLRTTPPTTRGRRGRPARSRSRRSSSGGTPTGGTRGHLASQPGLDPESLQDMSVRGLDLLRYAQVAEDGSYRCTECEKSQIIKSFKNKYSFQRHAFLYHEGTNRKVFPCLVCMKEFSRPDKMKQHLKQVHDCIIPKSESGGSGSSPPPTTPGTPPPPPSHPGVVGPPPHHVTAPFIINPFLAAGFAPADETNGSSIIVAAAAANPAVSIASVVTSLSAGGGGPRASTVNPGPATIPSTANTTAASVVGEAVSRRLGVEGKLGTLPDSGSEVFKLMSRLAGHGTGSGHLSSPGGQGAS